MTGKYKTWPNLSPQPSDAALLRKLWVRSRERSRDVEREYQRQLAADYWIAKISGKDK